VIHASTACLGAHELWPTLDQYAENGIAAVELGSCRLATTDGLADRLRDYGMHYLVHNYFPPPADPFVLNLASSEGATRRRSLDFVEDALELCAVVGSPLYSVHGGFVTDPVVGADGRLVFPDPPHRAAGEEAMDRYIAAIAHAADSAQRLDLDLLVENNVCTPENRGKLLLQTDEEIASLFAQVDSPALGLLLDAGHLTVTAATLGFDRNEFVERLTPWIRAIHAHENDGAVDSHHPVRTGGWVASLLARVADDVVVVEEAAFDDVRALSAHLAELRGMIGGE
jgi:sugar phosphate isomerase/epimerase